MAGRRHRGSCRSNTSRRRNTSSRRNISRSTRAELQFPVSRVDHYLREGNYSRRLSSSAPVFLAGVLEYIASNILDLAGEEAHANGRKRISPEHVYQVVENNQQLHELFGNPRSLGEEMSELSED
uniref:histone H2A-Bbd type 1-like n=1 Tax=Myodes glareolus TaxID=447135 RepID=UPI002021CAFD|nr:histone H2A-Bbd type 1-like [Myodes glareolus]